MTNKMVGVILLGEKLKRVLRSEKGQSLVEYGLIIAFVSIVAFVAVVPLREAIIAKFAEISDIIN